MKDKIVKELLAFIDELGINTENRTTDKLSDDLGLDSTEIADIATSITSKYGVDILNSKLSKMAVDEIADQIMNQL